jgi:hypothetical protein
MNPISKAAIAAGIVFLASASQSHAIEGLQISVRCPDVILSWPSVEGETYIVQYRQTLITNTPWTTLADWLPAAAATNTTFYAHSNQVTCSTGATNNITGGGSESPPLPSSASLAQASEPMVKLADGTGTAVPLCIYPPGFDLSRFVIFDPATGEWASGAGCIVSQPALNRLQRDDPQPQDDDPGTTDPATGFYRVVRDGAHLVGITSNMTLSGTVTIPVEVAYADGNLVSLSLTEDGSPVGGSRVQTPPFQLPLHVTVDTTMMSNGVHQLSASARWDAPGSSQDETDASYEADSDPIQVNIQNEISFPDWMPIFGDYDFGNGTNSLIINAQSAHASADWYIDFYDSQDAYIGTMGGHTYDGSIQVAWDLVGPYGETYYSDSSFAVVVTTVFPNSFSSASAAPPPIYRVTDPWLGYGALVIAAQHAFDQIYDHDTLYQEIDGFIGMAQSAGWGVMPPPDGDGHAYTIHLGQANDPQPTADWTALRSALYHPLARNFVYFGHGAPNGIGANPANTNRFISATEIGARLGTMPAKTNQHNFRLVFLDGCSTAKGKLPEAFGIIHKENVPGINYYNASKRPSAFVGWTADKNVGFFSSAVNYDHVRFIIWIQYYLALGEGIHDAITHAGQMPDVNQAFVNVKEMKVYGYWDLSFWAFNH